MQPIFVLMSSHSAYNRASSIQADALPGSSSSSPVPQSPQSSPPPLLQYKGANSTPLSFVATLWRAVYSCADSVSLTLCRTPDDCHCTPSVSTSVKGETTTNSTSDNDNSMMMRDNHRIQNASLMEFVVTGGGGILHKDSMSTVEGQDIDPDLIYGTCNVDEAMQDFHPTNGAVPPTQFAPPLTSVSTWSSSSTSSSVSNMSSGVVKKGGRSTTVATTNKTTTTITTSSLTPAVTCTA